MAFILWKEKYYTGIKEIDAQHKELVDIINELANARRSATIKEVLHGILSRLTDYTKYHFSSEEALLEKLKFPGLERHKAIHRSFMHEIEKKLEHYLDGTSNVDDMLLIFLRNWLLKHILAEDMNAFTGKKKFAPWKEEYSIGIEDIDAQHKHLIGIINQLYDAMQNDVSQADLCEIFSKLVSHTSFHFDAEEELMNELAYTGQEEHKATHQSFRDEILKMQWRVLNRKIRFDDKFMEYLKALFLHHIIREDMDVLHS